MNPEETVNQDAPTTIEDEVAQRWYDTGFKFALNYLFAWIPKSSDKEFNQEMFKALVQQVIGDEDKNGEKVIDEQYFERLHFYQGDNRYGNKCPDPDDPNVCIPCTTYWIQPVPKP